MKQAHTSLCLISVTHSLSQSKLFELCAVHVRAHRRKQRVVCTRVFLCLQKCDLRAVSRMTDEKLPFYSFSTRKTEHPNESSAKEIGERKRKARIIKTEEERHFNLVLPAALFMFSVYQYSKKKKSSLMKMHVI